MVRPDEWVTQEVIVIGNHIVIKLNGETTADFQDERKRYAKGPFAIRQHNDDSVVSIRKAEVKELP